MGHFELEDLWALLFSHPLTHGPDDWGFVAKQAIGQRNRVDSEIDNRNRQRLMLELLIKEKQTELERSGFYCCMEKSQSQ